MVRFLKYTLLIAMLCVASFSYAQDNNYREMHKVKKGETIFGIAKKYDITIEELIKANPDMNAVGYELKKGGYIFIPYSKGTKPAVKGKTENGNVQPTKVVAPKGNAVKVGVMLPLHNVDGDGRRMVEYYRGILMACEKLKKEGINVDIRAWNVAIDADINKTLTAEGAKNCDVIFGPLYSKQVSVLSEFARQHNIKLVIPFSITGNDIAKNPNIFQVYQSQELFYGNVVKQFTARFKDSHVVVVDCNDKQSDKGVFTFSLRKALAEKGMTCSITNIINSDEYFAKAFSTSKPNIVVLNTARSPELNAVIAKLDKYTASMPNVKVSLFGYTEWLMYAKYNMDKFCKYNTYVPSHFYYNPMASATKDFNNEYIKKFDQSMMDYMPRFAITGYDHAMFFISGISKQGKAFNGTTSSSNAIQAQLQFKKANGQASGMQNNNLLFVHYNTNKSISLIQF